MKNTHTQTFSYDLVTAVSRRIAADEAERETFIADPAAYLAAAGLPAGSISGGLREQFPRTSETAALTVTSLVDVEVQAAACQNAVVLVEMMVTCSGS